ncbi:putative permease [Roseibacterium elongatum DSM 19469]|uniref:Putative permease n=1 Tax=Roseicyclus elongatus DSM 19469 TaxID=1294273 RepID=W8S5I3_9RHOB|nr:LPS export ABC transporter permease LptF [Roseibacterium elongatum]AHM05467.1 putative permease [Roseibacterium elongatum DSM 19469]
MGRYDRYILTQLVGLFGFFSLVLVSVYWIEAAVELFGELIADGQNLGVFLEFTALTLPEIMLLVLPVASFVATLYVFNRMINESELVVLQTAGLSAARLLRPVFVFGLILSLLVLILANILAPAAREQFNDRRSEVGEDVTGRFLREGQFIHPADGLTVYIREITELGEFRDLFLQDASGEDVEVTYTATSALLVRSDTGPRLVMFDGMAQSLNRVTGRLSTVQFADFAYDIGALIADGGPRRMDSREMSTLALITADTALAEALRDPLAEVLYEGHDRIGRALFVMFPPLIAAATLMLGHFSRFGVWRQILIAVVLIVPLQVVWNWAEATATRDASLWPLAYLQAAVAATITLTLLGLAAARRRRKSGLMRRLREAPA